MKNLVLLLALVVMSCSLLPQNGLTPKPGSPNKPSPSKPAPPAQPSPVVIGSCFISSVSDAVYKVIRCNVTYCLVENSLIGETTMDREYVAKQLKTECPESLK